MTPQLRQVTGDVFEELPKLSDSSAHALFADPPWKIAFMNRSWDVVRRADVDHLLDIAARAAALARQGGISKEVHHEGQQALF